MSTNYGSTFGFPTPWGLAQNLYNKGLDAATEYNNYSNKKRYGANNSTPNRSFFPTPLNPTTKQLSTMDSPYAPVSNPFKSVPLGAKEGFNPNLKLPSSFLSDIPSPKITTPRVTTPVAKIVPPVASINSGFSPEQLNPSIDNLQGYYNLETELLADNARTSNIRAGADLDKFGVDPQGINLYPKDTDQGFLPGLFGKEGSIYGGENSFFGGGDNQLGLSGITDIAKVGGDLFGAYNAYQTNKAAEKQYKAQLAFANRNLANQAKAHNRELDIDKSNALAYNGIKGKEADAALAAYQRQYHIDGSAAA